MKRGLLLKLALRDLFSQKASLGFAVFGLVMGAATLVFFLSLVQGVRGRVINELFPVNLIEFTPLSGGFGLAKTSGMAPESVDRIKSTPGVFRVYPKKKAQFQAVLWGQLPLVAYKLHLEAFFDGVDPNLVQQDITPKPDASDPFDYRGAVVPCKTDDGCMAGTRCIHGFCGRDCNNCDGKCLAGRCLPSCTKDQDCLPGRVCAAGACQPLACKVSNPKVFATNDRAGIRGTVTGLVFDPAVHRTGTCPTGTYCATFGLTDHHGACEAPIPVVLSPLLTELYNSVASSAFHLPTFKDLSMLKGLEFFILYGESYFVGQERRGKQVIKQAKIAGFSPEAIDLGVTMPITYVEQANARMRGRKASKRITSLLVKTRSNEMVPQVVRKLADYGLVPTPKYQATKRMADVLFILALVFAAVALIVLIVSAGGIAHVLLMLVNEKAVELALFRSLGATRNAIRGLVLLQGAAIGVMGGLTGIAVAWIVARIADTVLIKYFAFLPSAPQTLFTFAPWILILGMTAAVIASLAGGAVPAERACRIDPARTLSKG